MSHWVQWWCWIVNQEASTYTLCWCRTGSNFDGGIWSWKWQHTLCAGVCIWFDIELQEKATMVPGVALGSKLDSGLSMQKWRPTLCAGVALDLILIMEFECKSGYLHFVLASRWVWFWFLYIVYSNVATYTVCWRRTASNFGIAILIRKRLPTRCADVALGPILML